MLGAVGGLFLVLFYFYCDLENQIWKEIELTRDPAVFALLFLIIPYSALLLHIKCQRLAFNLMFSDIFRAEFV